MVPTVRETSDMVPNSEGEQQHGHNSGGEDQLGLDSDGAGVEGGPVGGDSGVKNNMFSGEAAELHNKEGMEKQLNSLGASRHGVGVKFLVFFDIKIEEEDVCGRIEFGFQDNKFDMDIEEYFIKFEDKCSQSHSCLGRIRAVSSDRKDLAWTPRNIIDLLEKYGDGHVIDRGWREWHGE